MKKLGLFACLMMLFIFSASAQTGIIGTWKSIDDETGEAKSHVKVYQDGGVVYGKIVKILTDKGDDAICEACKGARKNQPVKGMVIIEKMKKGEIRWQGGTILDPESGNTYGCALWNPVGKNDVLKVRGKHWTEFYRTQTWYRVK